jgi:micrococcal nuclease
MKIHDGDTLSVRIGGKTEKIRLIGIDAPEVGQRPWGEKAKRHLADLIGASDITIVTDVRKRDRYGRLLAYVWSTAGRLVNLEMVRDGYAVIYTVPPNVRHVDQLRAAQREAREKKRGIWAAGGLLESPRDYRAGHPR